jgi:hypothetical protein
VEEDKVGFSWTASPFVGPNQGGLFLDAIVGPDRLFLVTVSGTRPRWAFLGQLCGTGPDQGGLFLDSFVGPDQTKVGFSWTALWDRTKPVAEEGGLFLGALVEPDQTRPDKTKADAGEEGGLFLDALVELDHAGPDQTRPDQK